MEIGRYELDFMQDLNEAEKRKIIEINASSTQIIVHKMIQILR